MRAKAKRRALRNTLKALSFSKKERRWKMRKERKRLSRSRRQGGYHKLII